jgi:hypothetical protein
VILHLKDMAVVAGLTGVGLGVVYLALRRTLRRAVSEHQKGTDSQLAEMAETIKSLEARLREINTPGVTRALAASTLDMQASAPAAEEAALQEGQGVPPETLAVITAAVTAYLGANVRVRSAVLMQPAHNAASAWSQQGRVFVQASHNIRTRR